MKKKIVKRICYYVISDEIVIVQRARTPFITKQRFFYSGKKCFEKLGNQLILAKNLFLHIGEATTATATTTAKICGTNCSSISATATTATTTATTATTG